MSKALDSLLEVMARLRDPTNGCPWDIKQNFKTIAPCALEEAYEVIEAIENDDMSGLCEELGDLLLQIVFHAQMAKEQGIFDFDKIATVEADKMIERHPHVFADRSNVNTPEDVLKNWEADKAAKREAKSKAENRVTSALDGVNTALPAFLRSLKLQQRAARVGFDWNAPQDVIAKIREETDELEVEIIKGADKSFIEGELGDLFFVLINLARKLDINPENALRSTNRKFERRFRTVETTLAAEGRSISDASLDEMERIWNTAKISEKKA